MVKRATDAALDQINDLHAKWLAGNMASEDVLFQIGDVIELHYGAAAGGAPASRASRISAHDRPSLNDPQPAAVAFESDPVTIYAE